MRKKVAVIAGILIICLLVFLFVLFREPITGFVSQTSSDLFEKETKLELSGVDQLIVYPGEAKSFSFVGINSGDTVLTGCMLVFEGDYASWIIAQEVQDIHAGARISFPFELSISDTTLRGTYKGKAAIQCNEISQSKELAIIVSEILQHISITEVKPEENNLAISYRFDHSSIVGEGIAIDVWLLDEEGREVARDLDIFTLQKDGVIERTFSLAIPESLAGSYILYLAVDAEPEQSINYGVLLGEAQGTGFAIFPLEDERYPLIGFVIIILITCVLVIFMNIKRRHKK